MSEVINVKELLTENTELRTALDAAMHELGVPGEGYPAPVANAYDIMQCALASDGSAAGLGCGACSECAASGNDPERCTGGLPSATSSDGSAAGDVLRAEAWRAMEALADEPSKDYLLIAAVKAVRRYRKERGDG